MTCEVYGNVEHSGDNCLETQEEALYLNGNNNGFHPQGGQGWNQPRQWGMHSVKEADMLTMKIDLLLKKFEDYSQDKAQM